MRVISSRYRGRKKFLKENREGQEWWLMPLIPALWEVEDGESQGQEFEISLANMMKPRLY